MKAATKTGWRVRQCSFDVFCGLLAVVLLRFFMRTLADSLRLTERVKDFSILSIGSISDLATRFPMLSNIVACLTLVVNFCVFASLSPESSLL